MCHVLDTVKVAGTSFLTLARAFCYSCAKGTGWRVYTRSQHCVFSCSTLRSAFLQVITTPSPCESQQFCYAATTCMTLGTSCSQLYLQSRCEMCIEGCSHTLYQHDLKCQECCKHLHIQLTRNGHDQCAPLNLNVLEVSNL